MQQIVILDYVLGRVDIYTLYNGINPETYITEVLNLNLNNINWMSRGYVIPLEVHCD